MTVVVQFVGPLSGKAQDRAASSTRSNQPMIADESIEELQEIPRPIRQRVSPQVQATQVARPGDGLEVNRRMSLAPFPNLDLQSGPLAVDQLPWHHKQPEEAEFSIRKSIEYQTAIGGLRSNGDNDGEVGWYNSLQFGFPFWRERQVGAQLGFVAEPTTFPQVLTGFTGGFFHRAIWPEAPVLRPPLRNRLSWGVVYDALYDSELETFIGQFRTQFGYSIAPDRECGLWFAVPLHDETSLDPGTPLLVDTSALVTFYYRHVFPREVDLTLLTGVSEFPGGAHFGGSLSYRFAPQAFLIVWGVTNFEEEGGHAVYGGLRFHFWPLADYSQLSGNPQNRYRPFLAVIDHVNLQVRKRP
jgi:hypothetical protein